MLAARPSTYSPTVSCLQLISAPDRSRSHSCYTSPCLQVKSRMRNREQYQDFLKCLNMFTEDIITKHELQSLVSDALNRHPDLQVGACSCVCCSHVATSACVTGQTPSCNCLLLDTLEHATRPGGEGLILQFPKQ